MAKVYLHAGQYFLHAIMNISSFNAHKCDVYHYYIYNTHAYTRTHQMETTCQFYCLPTFQQLKKKSNNKKQPKKIRLYEFLVHLISIITRYYAVKKLCVWFYSCNIRMISLYSPKWIKSRWLYRCVDVRVFITLIFFKLFFFFGIFNCWYVEKNTDRVREIER